MKHKKKFQMIEKKSNLIINFRFYNIKGEKHFQTQKIIF
jgi:hypothetical protein